MHMVWNLDYPKGRSVEDAKTVFYVPQGKVVHILLVSLKRMAKNIQPTVYTGSGMPGSIKPC